MSRAHKHTTMYHTEYSPELTRTYVGNSAGTIFLALWMAEGIQINRSEAYSHRSVIGLAGYFLKTSLTK